MEDRIIRLEARVDAIEKRLDNLGDYQDYVAEQMSAIRSRLDELYGRFTVLIWFTTATLAAILAMLFRSMVK